MFERERKLYGVMLGYCKLLTNDVDDSRLAELPAPGVNHPAWILTHLAICTDVATRILGEPARCPKEWHQRCGPGSRLTAERSFYASKRELIAALEAGQKCVSEAAGKASEEVLLRPNGIELAFVKNTFPTVGELVAHLMTTHTGFHLGQLSMWRRMVGMPGVLGIDTAPAAV
jgi:DinB superfamily